MNSRLDLTKATFIIPIRIESPDRLRNVITTTAFLLENFDTNIIIKEVDSESVFQNEALPILKEILDVDVNVNHIFEKSDAPLFHRQKVLNEMIMEADTEIVVNYDCDVLLPIDSYQKAYNSILDKTYDVVYPYGQGMYQKQVSATDEVVSLFLEGVDFSMLDKNSKTHTSDFGWVQFFNRQVYIDGGMENENFVSYGYEDNERPIRFEKLGYKVGRVNDLIYHMEHSRTINSWFTNPYINDNKNLYEKLKGMNSEDLKNYYQNIDYLQKRNG